MHPLHAKGAGYARHLAQQKYAGEDYYLQIDSHTELIQNWDELMIAALNLASETEKSSKVILSAYPAGYELAGRSRNLLDNHRLYKGYPQKVRPTISKRGMIAPKRVEKESDTIELSTMVLAGYIFAPGSFAEIEYNPHIVFWGEEFYIAMNAWMNGWRIYSPSEIYIWHHYKRAHFDKIWDDHKDWTDKEEQSYLYQEEYFKELLSSDKTHLLHEDHIDTMHRWLEKRRVGQGEWTEQSIEEFLWGDSTDSTSDST
jgi:hypothetical protein